MGRKKRRSNNTMDYKQIDTPDFAPQIVISSDTEKSQAIVYESQNDGDRFCQIADSTKTTHVEFQNEQKLNENGYKQVELSKEKKLIEYGYKQVELSKEKYLRTQKRKRRLESITIFLICLVALMILGSFIFFPWLDTSGIDGFMIFLVVTGALILPIVLVALICWRFDIVNACLTDASWEIIQGMLHYRFDRLNMLWASEGEVTPYQGTGSVSYLDVLDVFHIIPFQPYKTPYLKVLFDFDGKRSDIPFRFGDLELTYQYTSRYGYEYDHYYSGQIFLFYMCYTTDPKIVYDSSNSRFEIPMDFLRALGFSELGFESAMNALRDFLKVDFTVYTLECFMFVYIRSGENKLDSKKLQNPVAEDKSELGKNDAELLVSRLNGVSDWISGVVDIMARLKGHGLE